MRLSRHWDWVLRHMDTQSLPLNAWLTALFFKLAGASFTSLWILPALESLLTVLLAFWVAERFLGERAAWPIAFLLATSFWASYVARFSMQSNTMLLVELMGLHLLGSFLDQKSGPRSWVGAGALGLVAAAGFYSYPAYYPVGVLIVWIVAARSGWGLGPWKGSFWTFVLVLGVAMLPLAWDLAIQGSGNYLHGISVLGNPWGRDQWKIVGSYLGSIALFEPKEGDYLPVGGPFLNYMLGLLFLAGTWKAYARRKEPAVLFLAAAFLLSLVPALLTRSLEYLRLSAAMPFAFAFCGLGLEWVWREARGRRRWVLVAILLLSSAWEGWRLFAIYPGEWSTPSSRWAENIKSVRGYRAYQVLRHWEREKGPGSFLANLGTQVLDQSLAFATFSTDACRCPVPGGPRWVAVIVNLHYRPFLTHRFPEGRAYGLDWEGRGRYGGDMIFVVPPTDGNSHDLQHWVRLDRELAHSTEMVLERSVSGPRSAILKELSDRAPMAGADPFLASCLWEKIYTQLNYEVAYGERPMKDDIGPLILTLRRALSEGYPLAHLYNELGSLEWRAGLIPEAKKAFRAALAAPLNRTKAAQHLRQIELETR
ncbi:MAG TPA: glycosyltransferase family 39 protein [bacterium]|nr:glycosyltransferase family 39 protein [bacterium]